MLSLFRAVVDRLKALLAAAAASELESEALARHAERKAELLRVAARYEAEGLGVVAGELRRQAGDIDWGSPLDGVPAFNGGGDRAALPQPAANAKRKPQGRG